jgi:hypothetical protein
MCAIRFATEFVRDNEKYNGLSLAQWVVLPIGAMCLFALLSRRPERRPARVLTTAARHAVLATVGTLAVGAVVAGLPALEATVLLAGATVLLAVAARRITATTPGLAAMLLQIPVIAPDSAYPRTITTIGGGLTLGAWEAAHRYTNCDGDVVEQWSRRHRAIGSTLEVGARRQTSRHEGIGVRLRGYLDTDNAGPAKVSIGTLRDGGPYTQHSYGISFAADADWKHFGLTLGISGGQFYPMLEDGGGGRSKPLPFFPALGVRVGRFDGFSVEARIGDEAPMWLPAPVGSIALAFGDSSGNRVRIGGTEAGLLVAGRATRSDLEILPTVVIGASPGSGGSYVAGAIQGGLMVRKWIDIKRP